MNISTVSLQDCIDLFRMKRQRTIINDGKIIGFAEDLTKEVSNLENGNERRADKNY